MLFRSMAFALSVAFAAAPTAAVYCTAQCETQHGHGSALTPIHAGHHHHAASQLASISQAPQTCGHDHNGVVGVERVDNVASRRASAPGAAVMPTVPPLIQAVWISIQDVHGSNSPPGQSLRGFASPIRI